MLEKRALITRILCKPNYALQGTHNAQYCNTLNNTHNTAIDFSVFAGSFPCPEEMTWP